jgi:hypothetical protein
MAVQKISPHITPEILSLVAEIDEFKGRWQALKSLAPDRLTALRRTANIESIGSSTRIEGAKLSNHQVARLLAGLARDSFKTRDEQEVAGYARVMDIVFEAWKTIPVTENYIKQLHSELLKFSEKDSRHRGDYKKHPNHAAAFDADGKNGAACRVVSGGEENWDAPPAAYHRDFHRAVSGDSSLSGRQWKAITHLDDPALAASRLCLRSLFQP